jgi:HSP20 family molecular chaperone IbpA
MPKNSGRNSKVVKADSAGAERDHVIPAPEKMKPQGITAVYNKNGMLTLYVLMADGTIMFKREDEDTWHTTSLGMPL